MDPNTLEQNFTFTKNTLKKVWIWGLTPSPPLDRIHTFVFFFNDDLPNLAQVLLISKAIYSVYVYKCSSTYFYVNESEK